MLIIETRERLEQWLLETSTTATFTTNEGRKKIASVGLPGSVEIYNSGGKFPEQLSYEIERLQAIGDVKDLLQRQSELEQSAVMSFIALDEIDESLMIEERIDNTFRNRYPDTGSGSGSGLGSVSKSGTESGTGSGTGSALKSGTGTGLVSMLSFGSALRLGMGSGSGLGTGTGSVSEPTVGDKGIPSKILNADIKVDDIIIITLIIVSCWLLHSFDHSPFFSSYFFYL